MYRISDDDREFLEHCRSARVSRAQWNHEARVRVAYLLLQHEDFADAIVQLRCILLRVNTRHGIPNSGSRGYHETLTLAWARVIAGTGPANVDFKSFIADQPELLRKERILSHYSRERILTERARREFLLPDRNPLPTAIERPVDVTDERPPIADISPTMTGALLAATYG